MVAAAREGHIPSAFSILDILYVLYQDCLHTNPGAPQDPDRDYFILSKGHAGAALYAVLAHFGFFASALLETYCRRGSILGGHPDRLKVPGVEVSAGSLGHGIAMGVGVALGLRHKGSARKVVVLVGDGEAEEGSFWESITMIKNTGLTNLVVILDQNRSQRYAHPFRMQEILAGFDWSAQTVDGHDVQALSRCLVPLVRTTQVRPAFVVANTTKGFPVARFMNDPSWHRRSPNDDELREILQEIQCR